MLNKYFDKIYLINLDRRTDRMVECSDVLDKNNIIYERFSAVDGQTLNIEDYGAKVTKNELGCILSHLNIMKDIKENDYETILILEDDFELCPGFENLLDVYMSQLPEDWQWLYFGGSHFNEPEPITENISRITKTLTTHAYAIKREMVEPIIDKLESNVQSAVDSSFTDMQRDYNTYCTMPHLIYQADGFSDIQQKDVVYAGIKNSTTYK